MGNSTDKHQSIFRGLELRIYFLKPISTMIERSSRWQMFFKIGALKNFANFTEKHLCWGLFITKFMKSYKLY